MLFLYVLVVVGLLNLYYQKCGTFEIDWTPIKTTIAHTSKYQLALCISAF